MSLRICFIGLLVAVLAALLSELGFKQKRLLVTLSLVIMLSLLADGIAGIFTSALSIADSEGIGEVARCAVKAVGLGYVFGFTGEVCEELGERGIANAIAIGARVEIFLLVLPYFEKTVRLGVELLK